MTTLVFLDVETTSLRHDRRAWDIGLIVRRPGEADAEYQWFIDPDDLDLGNADLMSLKIGRFYDRHPDFNGSNNPSTYASTFVEVVALSVVEALTRDAHVVGSVPNFDTEVLSNRMRANGICPSWHYHLQDIEVLVAGFLRGKGEQVDYPYKSDEISRRVGVEPLGDEDRHTALGDARWAMRLWDAVMGQ